MLFQQTQKLRQTPSEVIGLTLGSYEAYCFDQAVWYLGVTLTGKLEQVGRKKQKGEAGQDAARTRILNKYLDGESAKKVYADPAAFFS